jgi:integrase
MSGVFKQTYTRTVPTNAQKTTHGGRPAVKWKGRDGSWVVGVLVEGDPSRCLCETRRWYGRVNGNEVPLYNDKAASVIELGKLTKEAEMGAVGARDPFEEHRKRKLSEHLKEWEASLLAGGSTAKHVAQTVACVQRIFDACEFATLADLEAQPVEKYLAGLRERKHELPDLDPAKQVYTKGELARLLGVKPPAIPALVKRHCLEATGNGKARRYPRATAEALRARRVRGRSIKTSNLYLDAVKTFCGWLVQNKRVPDNLMTHLSGGNVKMDRRHDRQTLTEEQLAAILRAAIDSDRTFRGLDGNERHHVYLAAMTTGFRADEVASLTPESFLLDESPPVIVLPVRVTKNRKGATQPIPPDAAGVFRRYLKAKPAGELLWPGTWSEKAAEMLRIELDACGIPYEVQGTDGPLFADFHALRHSYIALLDKAGATLKEAMTLARHSDPKLTMAVYGKARLHDLGGTVSRLPAFGAVKDRRADDVLRATGTGDASPILPESCLNLAAEPDGERARVMEDDGGRAPEPMAPVCHNPSTDGVLEGDRGRMVESDGSSPSRTRTYNKPVNSRLLYRYNASSGRDMRRRGGLCMLASCEGDRARAIPCPGPGRRGLASAA